MRATPRTCTCQPNGRRTALWPPCGARSPCMQSVPSSVTIQVAASGARQGSARRRRALREGRRPASKSQCPGSTRRPFERSAALPSWSARRDRCRRQLLLQSVPTTLKRSWQSWRPARRGAGRGPRDGRGRRGAEGASGAKAGKRTRSERREPRGPHTGSRNHQEVQSKGGPDVTAVQRRARQLHSSRTAGSALASVCRWRPTRSCSRGGQLRPGVYTFERAPPKGARPKAKPPTKTS